MLQNQNLPGILGSDVIVMGSVYSNGLRAVVAANLTCTGAVPVGNVCGFFITGNSKKYIFSSTNPLMVSTRKTGTIEAVEAFFANVTVKDITHGTISTDCNVYFTATGHCANEWIGSYVITYPDGRLLTFFDVHNGTILVNRQVLCSSGYTGCPTGESGTTGASGASGFSGETGSSGASGYSGTTGESGSVGCPQPNLQPGLLEPIGASEPTGDSGHMPYAYIYNSTGSGQTVPDLGYVHFDAHLALAEGISHSTLPAKNQDIVIIKPGNYHVKYSVLTTDIAYFVLNFQGKIIAASSYFKGAMGSGQQDTGQAILNVTSVPGVLRLQNVTGNPVSLSAHGENASILMQKIF